MFFTQEDYIKIQQWLAKNSVKDTEFSEASIPFNGNEIVSIVQGNQNKRVFLKDLVSQIFNLGVSDFVNITDKYDAPNISLEEAIRLIPSRARKEGQVITFLDREDHWHIYQFKGVLNQWNILGTWEDLFDWEKLIIDSILPDEEDLTKSSADANGNSYLSLKDRAYNPEDFSGLGRVILRKNIVEIEDPIYGKVKKNILTQNMINKSNTIYEIRYDFDLHGGEITIPEGCVLDFQGGSFNNGTTIGNNTSFIGEPCFQAINFLGNFCINTIYSHWIKDINNENKIKELFKLTNENIQNKVFIEKGDYPITASKSNENIINVKNNTYISLVGSIVLAPNRFQGYRIFSIQNVSNIKLEGGGKIVGDLDDHDFSEEGSHEYGHGIYVYQSVNVLIEGIEVCKCTGDAINISNSSSSTIINNIKIRNCNIHDSRRQGVSIVSANNIIVENNKIYNIRGTLPMAAIDIEPNQDGKSNNIILKNNDIDNCHNGIYVISVSSKNIKVSNTIIENVKIKNCDGISLRNRGYDTIVKNCTIEIPETITPEAYSYPILSEEGNISFENCTIKNKSLNTLFHGGTDTIFNSCNIDSIGSIYSVYGKIVFENCNIKCQSSVVDSIRNNNAKTYFFNNKIEGHFYIIDKTFVFIGNRITINDTDRPCIYAESSLNFVNIDNNEFIGGVYYVNWFLRLNSTPSIFGSVNNNVFSFNDKQAEGCIMLFNTGWRCVNNISKGVPSDQNYIDRGTNTMISYIQIHGVNRPSLNVAEKGQFFFDTTLNKPIWWTGTKWVDATGADV